LHGREKNRLRDDIPTIQGELRKVGYRTGAFVSAFPASREFGLARGFDMFEESFLDDRPPKMDSRGVVSTERSQRTAEEVNAKLLPWIRKHRSESFFVWLHYFDPHDPSLVPDRELLSKFVRKKRKQNKEDHLRSIYDAEIFFTDRHIGELVAELQKLGIRDDTVLIITADHGQGLGDHNWWGHGILYQEQIRVPLIINGPGIPRGEVVEELIEQVDLFPTIWEIAGERLDPKWVLDGQSLMPVLRGSLSVPRKGWAYSESHNIQAFSPNEKEQRRSEMYSLIKGDLKLIHYPRDRAMDQLYDLSTDGKELNDLINTRRDEADAMLAELRSMDAIDGYTPDPSTLSEEQLEHLRSLGYVE
jgi:arylsulfatase A-like enzyme